MAILAIILLGVGTFGMIAGVSDHNWFWIWVSAITILSGVIIGLRQLEKEGVFKWRPEFINSWKSESKKWDRLAIKVRIGKITLFDLFVKLKPFTAGVILFNYGLKTKNNPK